MENLDKHQRKLIIKKTMAQSSDRRKLTLKSQLNDKRIVVNH